MPPLEPYGNHAGNSGVIAWADLGGAIVVQFVGGRAYRYGPDRPGAATVTRMRQLARRGRGLAGFISREVAGNFSAEVTGLLPGPAVSARRPSGNAPGRAAR